MMRKLIALGALALAALACNLGSAPPTNAPDSLATSAAATLTALAPTTATQPAEPSGTAPAEPAATDTPPAEASPTAGGPTETAIPATPAPNACGIAYADSGSLYCLDSGGSPQVLATGASLFNPRLSTDGLLVAYQVVVSEGVTELWVANSDPAAGAPHLLAGNAQTPNADPANINSPNNVQWLPGTHTLVFDTRFMPTGGPFGPGEYISADLWTVYADTSAVSTLLPAGGAGFFAASPNGHTIAVSRGTGLDLVEVDGSNLRQNVVTFPSIITYSEYTFKPRPQWSADGSFFTIAIPSADPLAADSSLAIKRVAVDGAVTLLGFQPGNAVFGGSIRPQIAPDGQHLVYSAGKPDNTGDILHMLTLLGDAVGDNSFDTQVQPIGWGWAPDSQHYIYTISPPNGAAALLMGLTDPSPQVLISNLDAIRDMRWLDGSSFIFIGKVGGSDWSLYRQALDAAPQLLVASLHAETILAQSP